MRFPATPFVSLALSLCLHSMATAVASDCVPLTKGKFARTCDRGTALELRIVQGAPPVRLSATDAPGVKNFDSLVERALKTGFSELQNAAFPTALVLLDSALADSIDFAQLGATASRPANSPRGALVYGIVTEGVKLILCEALVDAGAKRAAGAATLNHRIETIRDEVLKLKDKGRALEPQVFASPVGCTIATSRPEAEAEASSEEPGDEE